MNRNQVGICLVGAGRAGMIHGANFQSRIPHAKIVAIADPSKEAALKACTELDVSVWYAGYGEALRDKNVDAVVVVAPTVFHREIVVAAAKAGKHVLCEKPMAMDELECEDMIRACRDNGVKLQMAFMRRFDESFADAKEVVDSGEIGDVVMVRSNTRGPSIPQKWMYDIEKSNGPLAEVNSHDIDTLRWFTGSEFKTVYAIGGNFRSPEALPDYPDFYDNVIMNASFENGMQGAIDGAQGVGYGYDARVEILGTKGIIFLGQVHEKAIMTATRDKGLVRPAMNSWRYLFRDAYFAEDADFVDCILEGREPKVTGHDGKMAVKVVNAGNKSIKGKCIVTLS